MPVKPHLKYNDTQARCSSCGAWKGHEHFFQRHIGDGGPPVWPRCKKCRGDEENRYRPKNKDRQKGEEPALCANGEDCRWFERLEQPAPLSKNNPHLICNSCKNREINENVEKAQRKAEKVARAKRR